MNTVEMTLPVDWLAALFNSDLSSYDDEDLAQLEEFTQYTLENYGNAIPIDYDIDSEDFTAWHDARQFGVLACNTCTVTFPVTKQEEV
jgi:hypothetical protein